MDPRHTLARVDLDETGRTLVLDWADGARAAIPLEKLRAQCPCATCRDLHQQAAKPKDPFQVLPSNLLQPSSEMAAVEPVGRYGMRVVWADGHDTGIYTFEYLRELGEPLS